MNAAANCKSSRWIDFLRHYGPIPNNDAMYDEQIQNALKRAKVDPIKFESQYLDELVQNFDAERPMSIVLTGTAGDGKTFYCREIWQALGGSIETWLQPDEVKRLRLKTNVELVVVKDLTATKDHLKDEIIASFAQSVFNAESGKVYLIAANDGQLIQALSSRTSENELLLCAAIEELLVTDRRKRNGLNLILYNLSRLSAAEMFPRVLDAVLNHTGWEDCAGCPYSETQNDRPRCPILENKDRLTGDSDSQIFRTRLVDLLRLCDLNAMHLPIRQLLILVSNAILGHPEVKDKLMNCKHVPQIIDAGTASRASVYSNVLGQNLGERKRESIEVFATLTRFGIGNETSNRIDNMLIFGEDDPELRPYFLELVKSDSYYGADRRFLSCQRAYLENTSSDDGRTFLQSLKAQRQRLFFTVPKNQEHELQLWSLSVFQSAGEYLDIYSGLRNNEKVHKNTLSRLVRGLNRIFTGVLLNNQDEVILATSGSCSQAKVSLLFEESISVHLKRGECVTINLDPETNSPFISVFLASADTIHPVLLPLNLTRFEYLSRVAEGALPSSFSQECYEDILAFKTKILRRLAVRRTAEGESAHEHMIFRLVELNTEGIARERSLEIAN
jgi:hypothetical protein